MPSLRLAWIFVSSIVLLSHAVAQDHTSAARHIPRSSPASTSGGIKNSIYHNPFFGLSYKLPFGWVDRTREMRGPNDEGKSLVLLSTFERPPEATGSTINSAVVIAAEKLPVAGVKTAADYFAAINELAEAKGFKAVNEPYQFSISAQQMARGDFSKPRGSLTMYQSSLAAIENGYALSFTFVGGSQDEIQDLIERLSLGGMGETNTRPRRH
jgi:hypothetical protein